MSLQLTSSLLLALALATPALAKKDPATKKSPNMAPIIFGIVFGLLGLIFLVTILYNVVRCRQVKKRNLDEKRKAELQRNDEEWGVRANGNGAGRNLNAGFMGRN